MEESRSAPPLPPPPGTLSRSQILDRYLDSLPYPPYPVQENAILEWFAADRGVLVCAPTGTGKTLIAEAALFEALHEGRRCYYTTPLIALTEQKYREFQGAAVRWGFSADDVGLVTGNRRINPDAKLLVVVAEILLNRLLSPQDFSFADTTSVVMDEFHNFADNERGIVWELSLGLLPAHVRLMLLSATVGNAPEFLAWLTRSFDRTLALVEGKERKVPLHFRWVGDMLLGEQLEAMAAGDETIRRTPTLVFCFNRDECWSVAEQLKGLDLLPEGAKRKLDEELAKHDFTVGAGGKIRNLLIRGVGVHHAGLLPRYRRVVEEMYQRKLLPVCVCTETLAAGINLPARSVLLTTLLKGPFGQKKPVDASTAQQIFGRAGRPQFDREGFVFSLAHEDDVRILRWKEKYDGIPENTKDPGLLKARKELKRKQPTRRENEQYWNESLFQKLQTSPPAPLYSKGPLPWRLLAWLLSLSPDVERLRQFIRKRLMDNPRIAAGERRLVDMLLTLGDAGFITLEPPPPDRPKPGEPKDPGSAAAGSGADRPEASDTPVSPPPEAPKLTLGGLTLGGGSTGKSAKASAPASVPSATVKGVPSRKERREGQAVPPPADDGYKPIRAVPTARLPLMLAFRAIQPLYGVFLLEQLAGADETERLQALESVLELPRPVLRRVRVPFDELGTGKLAASTLDAELIKRGLMAARRTPAEGEEEADDEPEEEYPPTFAEKLGMLFRATFPEAGEIPCQGAWAAGDLLVNFGGDFNKWVRTRDLTKQEGILFRHLLRLILLAAEFDRLEPPGIEDPAGWHEWLKSLADRLTETCRAVDPASTDQAIESARSGDLVSGEKKTLDDPSVVVLFDSANQESGDSFGAGLVDGT
jgi:superfamily II DNA/RNA helicase